MKRKNKQPYPKPKPPPPPPLSKKRRKFSDEAVREMILEKCESAGINASVRPEKIAQALYPEKWQTLLKRVRLTAKQLAVAEQILILRKGKPIPPDEMKGIVRLQIVPAVESDEIEIS